MRAAIIGLVAISAVVAGGLGIAAAVGVIGAPSTTLASPPSPSMTDLGSTGGTVIEGAKPHLTVIDGRATLMLPGALPAIFSVLPKRPVDLTALPSAAALRTERANRTVDKASAPSTRAPEGTHPQNPGPPPAVSGHVWTPPPVHAAQAPSQVGGPQVDLRHSSGGQSDTQVPPGIDPIRPAHADQTGRPDHAEQTGPPAHASDNVNGNAGNRGNGNPGNGIPGTGRPDHADQTGRPGHADQTGPPVHAATHGNGNSGNYGNGNGADSNRSSR